MFINYDRKGSVGNQKKNKGSYCSAREIACCRDPEKQDLPSSQLVCSGLGHIFVILCVKGNWTPLLFHSSAYGSIDDGKKT